MAERSTYLGQVVLKHYRETFKARVAAGAAKHMTLPYSTFGAFILPGLYLAIPHKNRPWLYQARWAVLAAVIGFNVKMISETSSTNMAFSYAAGLMGFWGCLSSMALLVWTRPQFEMERIRKRRKRAGALQNGSAEHGRSNGAATTGAVAGNGEVSEVKRRLAAADAKVAEDETVKDAEYEHYWQAFPEDGTFLERLDWVIDLMTNFRGAGEYS
jgi:hypothetical protein